jgi:hypothetical protein
MVVLAACGKEQGEPADGGEGLPDGAETGITPAPHGGGYCCPIDSGTCNCFRYGGWIEKATDLCPKICDLAPEETSISMDQHGCAVLGGPRSCIGGGPH